jgi:hypothetical protein
MQKLVIAISTLFLFWGCVSSNNLKPQKHNEISRADQPSQIEAPQDQYDYGKKYFDNKQYKEAIEWFLKAANQNHTGAQAYLGRMYSFVGYDVEQDKERGAYWFKMAAENGDASSQHTIADFYRYSMLGFFPYDPIKAAKWYQKAAEQGYPDSQFRLAEMYFDGEGVSQDYSRSFKWCEKSLEQEGHYSKHAQFMMGRYYEEGLGVSKDLLLAQEWYKKAANQGLSIASEKVNNFNKAYIDHIKKEAESGNAIFQGALGAEYLIGNLIDKNIETGLFWYTQAANQGNIASQFDLAVIYQIGKYEVEKDIKKAVSWYEKAAEQNHIESQYFLSQIYSEGSGIPKNSKKAAYWCKRAAEQGYVPAQGKIGAFYYKGIGIPKNYIHAYSWFSLVAAQGDENAKKLIDYLEKQLSEKQIIQAQELAAEIQYKIDHQKGAEKSQYSEQTMEIKGSGTGFFITEDGYILTCHHVIKNASEVKIKHEEKIYTAKTIRSDSNNDLALLKIDGSFSALAFSADRSAKMGQNVFTIGYPNPVLQGVNAKFTKGSINSLTGAQDDLRLYQTSIPVQPGNSGGAMLDENGNILGVIVAMLDVKAAFNTSGSLPQNVNYAIKKLYAQAIIDTLPEISDKLLTPSTNEIDSVERAKKATVMILSYF